MAVVPFPVTKSGVPAVQRGIQRGEQRRDRGIKSYLLKTRCSSHFHFVFGDVDREMFVSDSLYLTPNTRLVSHATADAHTLRAYPTRDTAYSDMDMCNMHTYTTG